jgi:hypothetical protein
MPTARGGLAASVRADLVFVVGGESFGDGTRTFEEHEVFNPESDDWGMTTPLPTARHGLAAVVVGAALYVIAGGETPGLSVSGIVEIFDTSAASAPPEPTIRRFGSLEEVNEALGLRLPVPDGYKLNQTIVAQPSVAPTLLRAIFFGREGGDIYLDVVLPPQWQDGPPGGSVRSETIGRWDGLVITDDEFGIDSAFECAEKDGTAVRCIVKAPRLGEAALTDFIESM